MHVILGCVLLGSVLAVWPWGAHAQDRCRSAYDRLAAVSAGGDMPATLAALDALEGAGCDEATLRLARDHVTAQIVAQADARLVAGDVAGAEALILQARGSHWAVQALRGDIAARRGDRAEAARQYNAALDTLGDPGQTPQSPDLVPVARQLAALAQENMMLAGSMDSTLSRGGEATGVMAVVSRGIVVEAIPQPAHAAVMDAPVMDEPAPVLQAAPVPPDPALSYSVIAAAAEQMDRVFLPIRFDFDSDRLDAGGLNAALRLSAFLKANHVGWLTVTGHTDDKGDAAYNLDLSHRRAAALRDFLWADGVTARIEVLGRGESEPPLYTDLGAYDPEELRTIARRVEITLGH